VKVADEAVTLLPDNQNSLLN